jgi:hypothetical protein
MDNVGAMLGMDYVSQGLSKGSHRYYFERATQNLKLLLRATFNLSACMLL